MFQEIAVILIGLLVVAYVACRIYRLFFSRKGSAVCGCGCEGCARGSCGTDHVHRSKA